MKLIDILKERLLALPSFRVNLALAGVALTALSAALISQYVFGLRPCELCLYQRIPFAIMIFAGLIGSIFCKLARPSLYLSALAMMINTGIAIFHSGVERKWWAGLTGCTSPDMSGSIEEVMARIAATAVTRCDEISWSMFGLSMANYNVALCATLAALIIYYLLTKRAKASECDR